MNGIKSTQLKKLNWKFSVASSANWNTSGKYHELLEAAGELMEDTPVTTHSSLDSEEEATPTVEAHPMIDGDVFGIHGDDAMLDNTDDWLDALLVTHTACDM